MRKVNKILEKGVKKKVKKAGRGKVERERSRKKEKKGRKKEVGRKKKVGRKREVGRREEIGRNTKKWNESE